MSAKLTSATRKITFHIQQVAIALMTALYLIQIIYQLQILNLRIIISENIHYQYIIRLPLGI